MSINMGHCRFHNTLLALQECQESLSDGNDRLSELSKGEREAAQRLFKLCKEMAEDFYEATP